MLLHEDDAVYTCTSLLAESASVRELYIVTVRRVRGNVDEYKVSLQLAHAIPTLTTARSARYNSTQCRRYSVQSSRRSKGHVSGRDRIEKELMCLFSFNNFYFFIIIIKILQQIKNKNCESEFKSERC